VFQVYADGVLVFESSILTGHSATQSVDLDMTGVQELKLVVLNGGDNFLEDHSVWAGARLF
jgi:NPCBM/NEW2 domain